MVHKTNCNFLWILIYANISYNVSAGSGTSYATQTLRNSGTNGTTVTQPQQQTSIVSAFGDLIVNKRVDFINIQFIYGIPSDQTMQVTSGGGSITQNLTTSMATISGGTAPSEASLRSSNALFYLPGHEGYVYFTATFTPGIANTRQLIGLFDYNSSTGAITDGYALGYVGTNFSIARGNSADSSETVITQTNFNIDKLDGTGKSGILINTANLNIFKISYGFGAATITFWTIRQDGVWFPFHKILYPNTAAVPHVGNPVLPMRTLVYKSAGAAATTLSLNTANWAAGIVGAGTSYSQRYFSINRANFSPGTNNTRALIIIRKKSSFGSKPNRVLVTISFVSSAVQSGTADISIVKNMTFPTQPTYTSTDQNSAIEYNNTYTSASAPTGGTTLFATSIGTNGQTIFFGTNFLIMPNETDTITFLVTANGNITVNGSIGWTEIY